jgi:hypothetical protein
MAEIIGEGIDFLLSLFFFVVFLIWCHYMLKKNIWPDMWPKDKRY